MARMRRSENSIKMSAIEIHWQEAVNYTERKQVLIVCFAINIINIHVARQQRM